MYPFQRGGYTPLHLAAEGGHTTCVEHLLSTPGIDVNIQNKVSWSINGQVIMICMVLNTILYMDGDVKNKTIEQLLLSLHTKTSVSLSISSPSTPSAMFVNMYTLAMSYTCMKGHVDDHVLHVHVYFVPTLLIELLYPLQYHGYTPLHIAAMEGHTACVEHLVSTPGIDVNIKDMVS